MRVSASGAWARVGIGDEFPLDGLNEDWGVFECTGERCDRDTVGTVLVEIEGIYGTGRDRRDVLLRIAPTV